MTSNVLQLNNYTRIPNEIYEQLLSLDTAGELKAMLLILRKTYGWNKQEDRISLSQFTKEANLSKSTVLTAIKKLVQHGLIEKVKTAGGSVFKPITDRRLQSTRSTFDPTEKQVNKINKKNNITGNLPSRSNFKPARNNRPFNVVVDKKNKEANTSDLKLNKANANVNRLIDGLNACGVALNAAKKLVTSYSCDVIEKQLEHVKNKAYNYENLPAFITAAIKYNYTPRSNGKKEMVEKDIKANQELDDALEKARRSKYIKTPSDNLLEIKEVRNNGWVKFLKPDGRTEERPINVLMMNQIEFI